MDTQEIVPITQQTMVATMLHLDNLNVDCLLNIFRMLSLPDLASVTGVCRNFRDIAAEAFKYEWKNKTIRLSNKDSNSKLESTAILRNFGNQLQNVQIVFDKQRNDTFFKLIIDKCSSQLKQVDLSSTCFNVHLERVLSKENIQRFNDKFVNLKALRFENNIDDIIEPECIEQQFPALEELSLSGYPFVNQNVLQFIIVNPQIKSLSSFHCNTLQDGVDMIRMIDQHLPRLERLGLWVHGRADMIEYQPRFLKALKHLKIHSYGSTANLHHLSISNERVEEMELELGSCDENVIDFICQYKELTKLAIRLYSDSPFDCKFLSELKKHLPKLTEIEICGFWRDLNHTDIVHFVHESKRLINFILRDGKRKDILDDMNQIRTKLDSTHWSVNYNASAPRQLHFVRAKRPGN
ncbi:uncharacterized protein LOC119083821 [Bradysia coprophila]|uniref:uncharacterized protein LOC119083821 n=1 Tax=Bradysia coprophila TaxID=38358 RepID=UPI00187D76F5|nr:uncharacterized protein LOC119083821 [Bradysia coprophila]